MEDKKKKSETTKILKQIEDLEKSKELDKTKEAPNVGDLESISNALKIEDDPTEKIEAITTNQKEHIVSKKKEEKESPKEDDNDPRVSHKNKKIIFAIALAIIVVILFVIVIFALNKEIKDKSKDKEKNPNDTTDIILTEEEKKDKINSYGTALETVIRIEYQKSQTLLGLDEANKLVNLKDDIVCNNYEIYDDGKIYLSACSINGRKVPYEYGTKQEPKEEFDDKTMIKIYVNEKTNEKTLSPLTDKDSYKEYIVHTSGYLDTPTLLGYSDYIFYYDTDYNVQMKNIRTDKKVLENINYTSVLPFRNNDIYDQKYIAVNINDKWGIYDIDTSKAVIAPRYDFISSNLEGGVTGPTYVISVLKDANIVVCKDNAYGMINYMTGKEIIPIKNEGLFKSGNYLITLNDNRENVQIFDYSGNEYLKDKYDKIYGVTPSTYILVNDKGKIKLVQIDGKVLYEFTKQDNMGAINYSIDYDNNVIFQFNKTGEDSESNNQCIEYSYNLTNKTGEEKESACGGIAKPVLYLYPEKETNVTVNFSNPEILETTYPKYKNSWQVKALPNGDLHDKDNKYYYALYWDEKKVHKVSFDEGFYVENHQAITFLEEKLSYIGLNDKERNEFIMYWLPVLERNGRSLVYFELTEERESYNKLLISPKPDSMLRVVIHIKKVNTKQNIKKQSLTKFNRKGFSVVEWGGTTY